MCNAAPRCARAHCIEARTHWFSQHSPSHLPLAALTLLTSRFLSLTLGSQFRSLSLSGTSLSRTSLGQTRSSTSWEQPPVRVQVVLVLVAALCLVWKQPSV
eukprot:2037198-Rhodomonas_salina.2